MREELARVVNPLIRTALDLKEAWRGVGGPPFEVGCEMLLERFQQLHRVAPALAPSRAAVAAAPVDLLGGGVAVAEQPNELYLGVAYPLACWVDELFSVGTKISSQWNERKLEVAFHGTNDRAWRFWQQARLAAERPNTDELEVFFLCVSLGFRGEWIEDEAALNGWLSTTRDRLISGFRKDWIGPPALDPPANVPHLHGQAMLRRMAKALAITVLIVVPITAWLVVRLLAK